MNYNCPSLCRLRYCCHTNKHTHTVSGLLNSRNLWNWLRNGSFLNGCLSCTNALSMLRNGVVLILWVLPVLCSSGWISYDFSITCCLYQVQLLLLPFFFFFIFSDTGRKIEEPELLEAIRLTVINNLLQYHPVLIPFLCCPFQYQ